MGFLVENIVYKWLHKLGININRNFLNEELSSHPDYPSLLSITRTLDKLGIDNIAMQVDKEKLSQVPLPFLAHVLGDDGFMLVDNLELLLQKKPDFYKIWTGVLVVAEKPDNWGHQKNSIWQRKQDIEWRWKTFAFAFLFLVSLTILLINYNIKAILLYVTSAVGLGIAILILQHELGAENVLTEQLCQKEKNIDCDAVLTSKKSKWNQLFGWSDIGLIYFSFLLIFLVIATVSDLYKEVFMILSFLSAGSLFFGLFSVGYQWKVVKRWCILCLSIVAVLCIQALIILPGLLPFTVNLPFFKAVFSGITFITIITSLWLLLIKPLLLKNKESRESLFSLRRFKKSKELFLHLLSNQKRVDVTPFNKELTIGNPDASLQMIAACNPYCNPCAKAHEILNELALHYNNEIGISFRFMIDDDDIGSDKTIATSYIFQYLKATCSLMDGKEKEVNTRRVLSDWFGEMKLENFKKNYPLPFVVDVSEQLKENSRWGSENSVDYTPAIFVNGRQLPPQYSYTDLPLIVDGILFGADIEQENNTVSEPVYKLEV